MSPVFAEDVNRIVLPIQMVELNQVSSDGFANMVQRQSSMVLVELDVQYH